MPQAIVDPEELRQFAQSLKKFSAEIQARINMISGQLSALSKTWRDQEQKKFSEEFEQQVKGVQRLIEVIEPDAKTLDALMRLNLPAGVDIEIKI